MGKRFQFRLVGWSAFFAVLWIAVSGASLAQEQPADAALKKTATAANETLWYGELDAGPRLFRFFLRVQPNGSGELTANLLSMDEGDSDFVLDQVVMDAANFSFALSLTKADYSGTIDSARETIEGTWAQGGAKIPLTFRKVASKPSETAKEIWLGTMQAGLQKIALQFRIYSDASGKLTALVDSVSQKAGGFKAIVKSEGNKLSLDIKALNAKFDGTKNDEGTVLVGKFTQGLAFDLKMKRVELPAEAKSFAPKRPQTPTGPFPYDSKEVTFKNPSANVELSGTLTFPKSNKPLAVAVLISGSGPQDRDESLLGHKPFAVLADYLSRNGIAVLRYDDRGVGKSTGDFQAATSKDFSSDVEAAIDFLKTESMFDPKQIGLIGHSEGGLIAPGVAAKRSDVAWIVLMAGTGVNGQEILYSQGQLIVAANGGDAKALRTQKAIQEIAFEQVKSLDPGADTSNAVEACAAKVIERITQAGDAPVGAELDALKKSMSGATRSVLQTVNAPWMRYFLTYEPAPALEKTKCPVLAVNGDKDLQVDAKLNLPKIEQALKAGGNKDFTIEVIPGLNHLFQTCSTGSPTEYESIEETLAPRFLETVGKWLKSRVK